MVEHRVSLENDGISQDLSLATGVAVASAATITTATALWIQWAWIALRHEHDAWLARTKLLEQKAAGLQLSIDAEFPPSLQAVAAAAFAIDGFYGSVDPLIALPQQTTALWASKRTPRDGRIVETLKTGFSAGAAASRWQSEVPWLFDLRNGNVHYAEKFAEPQAHPVAGNVSVERVTFCAENAGRAVDVLLDVLATCDAAHAKAGPTSDLAKWCDRWAAQMTNLNLDRSSYKRSRAAAAQRSTPPPMDQMPAG